jgi:hypothetical protein
MTIVSTRQTSPVTATLILWSGITQVNERRSQHQCQKLQSVHTLMWWRRKLGILWTSTQNPNLFLILKRQNILLVIQGTCGCEPNNINICFQMWIIYLWMSFLPTAIYHQHSSLKPSTEHSEVKRLFKDSNRNSNYNAESCYGQKCFCHVVTLHVNKQPYLRYRSVRNQAGKFATVRLPLTVTVLDKNLISKLPTLRCLMVFLSLSR